MLSPFVHLVTISTWKSETGRQMALLHLSAVSDSWKLPWRSLERKLQRRSGRRRLAHAMQKMPEAWLFQPRKLPTQQGRLLLRQHPNSKRHKGELGHAGCCADEQSGIACTHSQTAWEKGFKG